MANYNLVIDSSFKPFSFEERLAPIALYKKASEEAEEKYIELSQKAGDFEYLSKTMPEGSRARAIYEGYANDLKAQAEDFAQNGLNINNRRALTGLRSRFQGEIGQLVKADEKLNELLKARNALTAAGKTMLYANDNPTIDDMLEGSTFNRYGIDTDDLHKIGEELGKSMSSRVYNSGDAGSTLQGMYRRWVETHGVQNIAEFMQSAPVRQAIRNALIEKGVATVDANGNVVGTNLSGDNLRRAEQSIINGVYNGIIYEESVKPFEDKSKLTAYQAAQLADSRDARALNASLYGRKKVNGQWVEDPNIKNVKGGKSTSGKSSSSSSGSGKTEHKTISKDRIRITWDGDPKESEVASKPSATPIKEDEAFTGSPSSFDELPEYAKEIARKRVGRGKVNYYDYYFRPYEGGIISDDDAVLEMVPKSIVTDDVIIDVEDIENDPNLQ